MPLNFPCFALCVEACEALFWETVVGIFLCVAGCKIACDSDTLAASDDPEIESPTGMFPAVAESIELPLQAPTINSVVTVSIPGGTRTTVAITSYGSDGAERTDTIQRDVVGNVRTSTITTVSYNPNANPASKTTVTKIVVTAGAVGSDGKQSMSSVLTLGNQTYSHSSRCLQASGQDSGTDQQNLIAAFTAKGLL